MIKEGIINVSPPLPAQSGRLARRDLRSKQSHASACRCSPHFFHDLNRSLTCCFATSSRIVKVPGKLNHHLAVAGALDGVSGRCSFC